MTDHEMKLMMLDLDGTQTGDNTGDNTGYDNQGGDDNSSLEG